jgi:casein kinase I family protein HRR25
MLIYFLRGTLPWRKIKGATVAETWDAIRDKKLEALSVLTVGLPVEFEIFFNYARGLEFEDLPDYAGLRDLFKGLAKKKNIEYDEVYDWTLPRRRTTKRFCEACNARR